MTTTLPTDALVSDVLEAKCRQLMARRAALPNTWVNRKERARLVAEVDVILERWNWLVLGR